MRIIQYSVLIEQVIRMYYVLYRQKYKFKILNIKKSNDKIKYIFKHSIKYSI